MTVTPELRFEVSSRLRDEWHNGKDYYRLHGRTVHVPDAVTEQPDRQLLTWHNEVRFLG